jgi:glycolate oxidase FAD binding subunit
VRLHPRPRAPRPRRRQRRPGRARRRGGALAALPLEADCLDVAWRDGAGALLVRFGGAAAERRPEAIVDRLRDGRARRRRVDADDDASGTPQRAGQRSAAGACSRSPAGPRTCPAVLARARGRTRASSAAPRSGCTG